MRITPIERPSNPLVRLLCAVTQRRFGRALTPFKVIFARLPRTVGTQFGIYAGLAKGLGIGAELQLLLQHHVAALNGCGFCDDIGRALAVERGMALDKLDAAASWRTSPLFTDGERAALRYVEEATQTKRVSDETFAALRAHFDDRQIVAITWVNAVENYFNLLNGPLGIESDGLCAIAQSRRAPAAVALRSTPGASLRDPAEHGNGTPTR
jgi:AhpD family alkylhydroperoxidase